MKSNRYIEKRDNGVAVVDYIGSSKQFVARFELDNDGHYTRTIEVHKSSFPNMTFLNLEDIRTYYGIPLRAEVYYKATEEETNGEYREVPICYEIEKEVSYERKNIVKRYPITVSPDGKWLVSDEILQEIAALNNQHYDVTIMY